jgi:hypothetical protein
MIWMEQASFRHAMAVSGIMNAKVGRTGRNVSRIKTNHRGAIFHPVLYMTFTTALITSGGIPISTAGSTTYVLLSVRAPQFGIVAHIISASN